MREISFYNAVTEAIKEEMLRDERLYFIYDNEYMTKFYSQISEMTHSYGDSRAIVIANSQASIVGFGVGMAEMMNSVIINIMAKDVYRAMEQIAYNMAKLETFYAKQFVSNVVLRVIVEEDPSLGIAQNTGVENIFCALDNMNVVYPSTPADAKALLKSAIRGKEPTVYIENTQLYNDVGPMIGEESLTLPIGISDIKKEGSDITIFSYGPCVKTSLKASEELKSDGIQAKVVDLRTLKPMDKETIVQCACESGRVIVVEPCSMDAYAGNCVARTVVSGTSFDYLKAPLKIIASKSALIPYNPHSKTNDNLPTVFEILEEARQLMNY